MDFATTISGSIDLVRAAKASPDQACLLSVMERHGPGLVQMLWRILGNQDDVADAYQETFYRLAILLREGKSWNKKGFVYRLSANIGIDMLRRRKLHDQAQRNLSESIERENGRSADSLVEQRDDLEKMQQAIADLPEHLRQVLILRDYADLDYGTIASSLQITAASARQFRHRAILILAEKLKGSEGNENGNE
jgi:RNA polymerase sigma-70 factor (ECF subfamily)